MFVTLLSIFVSLIPSRYRGYWLGDGNVDVTRGAIISGAFQMVVAGFLMWWRYPAFLAAREQMAIATIRASNDGQPDHIREGFGVFSVGFLTVFEYLFLPLTVFLIYMLCEGMVRLTAAVATGEVVPSLPLQLLAWLHGLGEYRHRELKLGPRVVDEVKPGVGPDYDLMIESSRPKPWNKLSTVSYHDELYEVVQETIGQPPRRFIYLLRRSPVGKVVRGLHHYEPEETLQKS